MALARSGRGSFAIRASVYAVGLAIRHHAPCVLVRGEMLNPVPDRQLKETALSAQRREIQPTEHQRRPGPDRQGSQGHLETLDRSRIQGVLPWAILFDGLRMPPDTSTPRLPSSRPRPQRSLPKICHAEFLRRLSRVDDKSMRAAIGPAQTR